MVASTAAVRTPLPPHVAKAKQAVLRIAGRDTLRADDVAATRAELEPHIAVLADHFRENRPANELALTRGTWKSLWFDDPDIDRGPAFLKLRRDRIWQVVDKDYYYNVSDSKVSVLGFDLGSVQSYLKGKYTVADRMDGVGEGAPDRRNVINLEFDRNSARLGGLPKGANLKGLVDGVDSGDRWTLTVPGPKGITGELWNLYVDPDLRISAGVQDGASKSTNLDLYVLRRGETA